MGLAVAIAVVAVVAAVGFVAVLVGALEDVVVDDFAEQSGFFAAGNVNVLDLAADFALFIGEEEVDIAAAADEGLPLQTLQAFADLAFEGETVGVHLVDAEGNQVVHVGFDDVDIANQEQGAQQFDVEGFFQVGVVFGLFDGAFDGGIEKAVDGRVEVVQRDQHADRLLGVAFGSGLEGIQHGTLAARQVQASGASLADRFENLLDKLEVERREGVVEDEIFLVLVALHGRALAAETELILEDVAFFGVQGFQGAAGVAGFFQQTGLDDFVGIGAGKGQSGVEAALNLGKVVGAHIAEFTDDRVDVFLRGDDDPGAAVADAAQVFSDGL